MVISAVYKLVVFNSGKVWGCNSNSLKFTFVCICTTHTHTHIQVRQRSSNHWFAHRAITIQTTSCPMEMPLPLHESQGDGISERNWSPGLPVAIFEDGGRLVTKPCRPRIYGARDLSNCVFLRLSNVALPSGGAGAICEGSSGGPPGGPWTWNEHGWLWNELLGRFFPRRSR